MQERCEGEITKPELAREHISRAWPRTDHARGPELLGHDVEGDLLERSHLNLTADTSRHHSRNTKLSNGMKILPPQIVSHLHIASQCSSMRRKSGRVENSIQMGRTSHKSGVYRAYQRLAPSAQCAIGEGRILASSSSSKMMSISRSIAARAANISASRAPARYLRIIAVDPLDPSAAEVNIGVLWRCLHVVN